MYLVYIMVYRVSGVYPPICIMHYEGLHFRLQPLPKKTFPFLETVKKLSSKAERIIMKYEMKSTLDAIPQQPLVSLAFVRNRAGREARARDRSTEAVQLLIQSSDVRRSSARGPKEEDIFYQSGSRRMRACR